jgi:hypothetical protein
MKLKWKKKMLNQGEKYIFNPSNDEREAIGKLFWYHCSIANI